MLRGLPLCQWLPLLFWRRAAHWLWPVTPLLTLKLATPGTKKKTEAVIFVKHESNLFSPPSSPLTLDPITVELRTSLASNGPTPPLLMLHVSKNVTHVHEVAPKVLLSLPWLFSPLLPHQFFSYSKLRALHTRRFGMSQCEWWVIMCNSTVSVGCLVCYFQGSILPLMRRWGELNSLIGSEVFILFLWFIYQSDTGPKPWLVHSTLWDRRQSHK